MSLMSLDYISNDRYFFQILKEEIPEAAIYTATVKVKKHGRFEPVFYPEGISSKDLNSKIDSFIKEYEEM